jgi:hypothetical protein
MKPPMPRAITALSRSLSRRRKRWGNRPGARNAYMVAVNDDGYPLAEAEPNERPRVIRPASCTPGRALPDPHREARIRWHSIRIERNE